MSDISEISHRKGLDSSLRSQSPYDRYPYNYCVYESVNLNSTSHSLQVRKFTRPNSEARFNNTSTNKTYSPDSELNKTRLHALLCDLKQVYLGASLGDKESINFMKSLKKTFSFKELSVLLGCLTLSCAFSKNVMLKHSVLNFLHAHFDSTGFDMDDIMDDILQLISMIREVDSAHLLFPPEDEELERIKLYDEVDLDLYSPLPIIASNKPASYFIDADKTIGRIIETPGNSLEKKKEYNCEVPELEYYHLGGGSADPAAGNSRSRQEHHHPNYDNSRGYHSNLSNSLDLEQQHLKTLGIKAKGEEESEEAFKKRVRAQYKRLILKQHPDKNTSQDSEAFRNTQSAYKYFMSDDRVQNSRSYSPR